jgi:hypothetical protein
MGAKRSYLDLYMGFGWSISAATIASDVIGWRLGNNRLGAP